MIEKIENNIERSKINRRKNEKENDVKKSK